MFIKNTVKSPAKFYGILLLHPELGYFKVRIPTRFLLPIYISCEYSFSETYKNDGFLSRIENDVIDMLKNFRSVRYEVFVEGILDFNGYIPFLRPAHILISCVISMKRKPILGIFE